MSKNKTGISLITMGAGNVLVLEETLKSFQHVYDEVIFGDMLLFQEDREILKSYQSKYNLKIVKLEFNYLFKNGFSACLNELAFHASNDIVFYMNVSEVIDEEYDIVKTVKDNPKCNTFYFIHRSESHRWFRMYNKKDLQWSGMLHEQVVPEDNYRPYRKPVFMMKDLPKDNQDPFKAKVFDTLKEINYFTNYMAFIDFPEKLGGTDSGWIKFATENYDSFKERLEKKGEAYEAVKRGSLKDFLNYVNTSPEFASLKLDESSIAIEYQSQTKKFLL